MYWNYIIDRKILIASKLRKTTPISFSISSHFKFKYVNSSHFVWQNEQYSPEKERADMIRLYGIPYTFSICTSSSTLSPPLNPPIEKQSSEWRSTGIFVVWIRKQKLIVIRYSVEDIVAGQRGGSKTDMIKAYYHILVAEDIEIRRPQRYFSIQNQLATTIYS